jgi:UDP-N-acetylmuramate dehydrogenase
MKNQLEVLREKYPNEVSINKKLSSYNWFNTGGDAEIFYKPKDVDQLSAFLKTVKNNYKVNIIGAGSNILIRDGGLQGITIKLGSKFSYTTLIDENIIQAGAGTFDKTVSNFATNHGLSGLEFLSCIPGSIGGAIKMNTGCYENDISKILVSIEAMDHDGNIRTIKAEQIKFIYRGCDLPENLIILSAEFKGQPSNVNEVKKKQIELIQKKRESQPSQIKTCGSTFKNPKDRKAWKLIKESNCDKFSLGQAIISEKHCNFFINNGNATSEEIEGLIYKVKNEVLNKTGVNLELEIKVIGKKRQL